MERKNKKIIFLSFGLILGLGLVFLFLAGVRAETVDVSALVYSCGNGAIEAGETCEADADCSSGQVCTACACQSPSSFLAGTKISLADNKSLPIEKIKAGEAVISYNELKKRLEPAKVLQIFIRQTDRYLLINNQVKVTARHPFYVNGQEWREAGELKIGDKLLNQAGQMVAVFSIKSKAAKAVVYNLEVDRHNNYFAEGYLVHNKGPVCGATTCAWGACINSWQTGVCGNGCGSWPSGQACAAAACGDGTVNQTSEECDDGNTAAGDGCSAGCQLEAGCGNGIIESGEECDDDDIVSGDCCSSACKKELIISNVSESAITNISAAINWQTLCEPSQAVLDWGITAAAGDGSASGLFGTSYSQTINNLSPNKVYYYRITATAAGLQTVRTGSFKTLGGAEICDNNADDDQDGLIDLADADCPAACLSDWTCGPWQPEICPESKIQTRECFDNKACLAPINEPPSQQSCGEVCPGLSCGGTCEKINIESCACEEYVPCCGSGICENSETFEQCPADCVEICLPDWSCEGWSGCDNGAQTRRCFDLNNCGLNIDRPPEEKSCLGTCEAACSTCQTLDQANCQCLPEAPCCGNRICEPAETNRSCPIDCAVPPQVRLTLTQCLDGIDNDRDGLVDYPADAGCQTPADNSEMTFLEFIQNLGEFIRGKIWDNPRVQAVNKRLAAPALIAAVAFSTASTFSFLNFLSYLRFLFTQPVYAIGRRKRYKWGVVYNALTKQPVDLAIVRFYEKETNQLVQSRVTDRLGRYLWLAEPGRYYLTVIKPKFNFPTVYLKDKREDVKYLDLYHGEAIEVKEGGASVALNIPLDPTEDVRPVGKIIFQHYLRRIQYLVAFSAIPLAVISFFVSPGLFTFSLLIFHCLLYALFRRLGYEKPPKNWGIIYDQEDKKPLRQAITRIYDKQYHKLLETRLTDSQGRYSFLVNNNLYYLTAEKSGYNPYQSQEIDLINKDREAIVNMDIALAKALAAAGLTPAPPAGQTPPAGLEQKPPVVSDQTPPPAPPAPAPEPKAEEINVVLPEQNTGVSRESLDHMLKSKEAEAKQDEPAKEKSIFG
ncbi:MAG: hypothetical protein A3B15_03335 [Candidatus Buchananbacteria bacterium RIFCSPLOWO2_01_FULL_45_31]|uniref:Hint domain-containing protein n=1 Tax=Candidatus Buchananbacteria bacterium RIFCSPLOWO2_01_FULL_45_31 TaxID=1797545 RepID=A0A1G1YPA7_9BACT|nr:MAG: hypothetical protein A3B15_03335 [Candidatus Buchananbacteria bacterium RIFCSPLOWO2_01_FULL_45_31]